MTIGERVRQIRKDNGLTLEKFGARIGLKKSALSQFERGTANPSDRTILSICREFNISEEWLRTGAGEMTPKASQDEITDILRRYGLPMELHELFARYGKLPKAAQEAVVLFARGIATETGSIDQREEPNL